MTSDMSRIPVAHPRRAVLLPGTGSDDVFIREVFAAPLAARDIELHTPRPHPGPGLVTGFLRALDEVARHAPVLAGGVSLGAHLAAEWALAHPERCAGLLLAMPAWLGPPGEMPAAVSARAAADGIDSDGMSATLTAATAGVPHWLGRELRRAWPRQGEALPSTLRTAAEYAAPTERELADLAIPTGIAACTDDPVHPLHIAERMAAAIPGAALRTTSLTALGTSRTALGHAAVAAWLDSRTTLAGGAHY